MSIIASLKNIDIQRHAVCSILDALEIDIDPEDGHLIFAADPSRPIDINGKILRLDIGKPIPNTEYTIFNPLTREDHAQFLMTLTIHSQVFSDYLTPDEACAAEFHIESETELLDESGNPTEAGAVTITIADKDDTAHGVGEHIDPAIATVFAILDYMLESKMISEMSRMDLVKNVEEAYAEYTKLAEMKPSERKNIIAKKTELLNPPPAEDTSEGYFEVAPQEEEVYEDDPNDDADFSDEDFEESEEEEEAFVEDDFSTDELMDMMGITPPPRVNQNTRGVSPIVPIEEVNFFDDDSILPNSNEGIGMVINPSQAVGNIHPVKSPMKMNQPMPMSKYPESVTHDGLFVPDITFNPNEVIEFEKEVIHDPDTAMSPPANPGVIRNVPAMFHNHDHPRSMERSMDDVNFFE